MARKKRFAPEQIITMLREAEVKQAQGVSIGEICKPLAITDQTYYRWRKEFGGLKVDQAKRLKELEREDARLKKVVADQVLDIAILKEAAAGNFRARRGGDARWRRCAPSSRSASGGRAESWARSVRRSGIGGGCAATRRC
jgi:transposase-like protein